MWFVILFFNFSGNILDLTIRLDLLSQETQVGDVVFLFQLLVMLSDDVLLLLLPPELFPLKISNLLNFFAFLYKTVMGLFVDLLKVGNILLSFGGCVVVYFVWSLRS